MVFKRIGLPEFPPDFRVLPWPGQPGKPEPYRPIPSPYPPKPPPYKPPEPPYTYRPEPPRPVLPPPPELVSLKVKILPSVNAGDVTLHPSYKDSVNHEFYFPEGTTVTLVATPKRDWAWSMWMGDVVGSSNVVQLLMDEDKEVQALFISKSQVPPAPPEPSPPLEPIPPPPPGEIYRPPPPESPRPKPPILPPPPLPPLPKPKPEPPEREPPPITYRPGLPPPSYRPGPVRGGYRRM